MEKEERGLLVEKGPQQTNKINEFVWGMPDPITFAKAYKSSCFQELSKLFDNKISEL